ncbi:butyrophilin subfamily 3 member A3-like [Myotis lucifugus]|uniref:butyrophilin subfamily 3 member A3-like n=2 Tax=Myotis TaxID=9434 RepID=UPI000CCC4DCD|nr:butyrophilin subfamily 3 member A3-like [Myotis lucifugus]
MVRSLVFHLLLLPVCLPLVHLHTPCSAQFAVVGPPHPILAMVGEVAELPCHLTPKMSAETMDLMWVRPGLRLVVRTYAHGMEEIEIAEYRGRTSILRGDIAEGKAALRIHKVKVSDSGIYQCYFQDGDFLAKAQVVLKVAGPFFSSPKPWRAAFGVTLLSLLGILVGAVIYWGRQQERIRALSQWERIAKEKLQEELRRMKQEYLAPDVILDPDTAHPNLLISKDQRSLKRIKQRQSLPDNPRRFQYRFCVLGRECFTSGRHFWEVEVGDRKQWNLGVCRENVERKRDVKITPQNGFWTIALLGGHAFHARTDPWSKLTIVKPPKRVGVFLDYERGKVSFYDAIDGLHIYTFSQTPFSGPLWPVFRILTQEPTALTICPALKGMRSSLLPDPLPDPSLETPVASGSANSIEDPQAEVKSLLPPAQP